jgi:hypothetical protein
MLKQEYPWLDGSEDANLVAAHTRDLFEYLAGLHAQGRLDNPLPAGAEEDRRISCPAISRRRTWARSSADVLRLTGAEVETMERCSAVGRHLGHEEGNTSSFPCKLADPLFKHIEARPGPIAWPPIARWGGAADQPGHRPRRRASHPHPRLGLRARGGGVSAAMDKIRPDEVDQLLRVREGPRRAGGRA